MNKEEIMAQIDRLKRKVKTPGRAYSKSQRDDMKAEISNLSNVLRRINFQEDLILISEFESNNPDLYVAEKDNLKIQINTIQENSDDNVKRIIELKINKFLNSIVLLESTQNETIIFKKKLSYLDINETIPFSNTNSSKNKEELQKKLATYYKSLTSRIIKLRSTLAEIVSIKRFFDEDSQLKGFVFMTNPIFSDASNFEKGFATVVQNTNPMYFSFNGNKYHTDTVENEIPKIEKHRLNPDLIPFQVNEDRFNTLYGYKNSKNEIVIPAIFKHASTFNNGFAKVGILKKEWEKYKNTKITYGLIDSTGRIVLPCDFIELGDVYNDIVLYKKHVHKQQYVPISSFNHDVRLEIKHLGFFSGYLVYHEIKPAILMEIDQMKEIESSISTLKTHGEVDNALELINEHREKIDFYLTHIIENQ